MWAPGSVITDAVPPEALALGRARQVVKPGWVKKEKPQMNADAYFCLLRGRANNH